MKNQSLWDRREGVLRDIEEVLFPRVEVGRNELEKMQDALKKMFNPGLDIRGVAAFGSFHEAYMRFTGDERGTGGFYPQNCSAGLRSCQDFTSSSFTYALQNALSMYLSKEYKRFPYHEEVLISDKRKATDFRTVHSVQVGYFDELPDVEPEAGNYQSISQYGDQEAQYDIGQKGTVIFVTRKHILEDLIGLVQAMVSRMARVARKTHAQYVWNFFINNSNCPDGTAWFTGGHGNLGSSALDYASLVTAITALANMTEPTPSSTKIGLDLASFTWHLVVPIDLWDLAVKRNQSESYYTINDLTEKIPNPIHRLFGDHNERVIVVPFFTDANDWGVLRDVADVPLVEMSYLNGKEDPEFVYEQGPVEEHVFRGDKWGFKIRHEYGGVLADYRGGYKAVVV
jgi:hypothetical protein